MATDFDNSLLPKEIRLQFRDPKDLLARVRLSFMPPEHLSVTPMEYAEKYVKIKTLEDIVVPFRINPVQRIYKDLKEHVPKPKATGKRILVLKARRMGITTYEQAESYAMCRTRRNTKCMTIAQTQPDTQTIFEMVLRMHQDDPNYARLDKDRKDALAYKVLRSEFKIGTAGGVAVARGSQLSRVHGSEVAFWDISSRDTDNLTVALCEAAQKGEVVYESTANGVGGWYYDRWQEATQGKGMWAPIFLGWYMDARNQVSYNRLELDELIGTLTDDEHFLVDRFGCTAGQLLWRRERLKGGASLFKQEFPCTPDEAFISSGTGYFNTDTLARLTQQCKDPIRETDGLCVWSDPVPGRKYVMGVDTSEGNETSDDTPIVILDWATGEQVMRWNGKAKPHVLGHKCVEFAKLYNGALLAVENNNTGHSVLNTIMNVECYQNVYWHEDTIRDEAKESHTPGWRTTGQTRPLLLSELDEAIEKGYMRVHDKLFLSQCRVFKDTGTGKSETNRSTGSHGDLIFAWGIAWQARKMKWGNGSSVIFI